MTDASSRYATRTGPPTARPAPERGETKFTPSSASSRHRRATCGGGAAGRRGSWSRCSRPRTARRAQSEPLVRRTSASSTSPCPGRAGTRAMGAWIHRRPPRTSSAPRRVAICRIWSFKIESVLPRSVSAESRSSKDGRRIDSRPRNAVGDIFEIESSRRSFTSPLMPCDYARHVSTLSYLVPARISGNDKCSASTSAAATRPS